MGRRPSRLRTGNPAELGRAEDLLASKAQALAEAGRVDDATVALVKAQQELAAYQERYAEPILLLAEAVLGHARSDDPSDVAKLLAAATELAPVQGGQAIARRVRATAERMGYLLP